MRTNSVKINFSHARFVCVHLTQLVMRKTCAEMRINMNDNNTDINASVASVVSSPDTFSKKTSTI